MTAPDTPEIWASDTGGDVVTGLVPTATEWLSNSLGTNGVTSGLVRVTVQPADLSGVLLGHVLELSGFTHAANNGTFAVVSADDAANTILIQSSLRTDASLNETGVTGAGRVYSAGALKSAPTLAQQRLGWVPGQKPSAQHLNWVLHGLTTWIDYLSEALPADYDLLQARLSEGDNITITDNGDGTQRISASLTVTQVPSVGETFTQTAHGFAAKDVVRHNGTQWVKAQASTLAGCHDVWLVVAAPSANTFSAVKTGRYTLTGHGLSAGTLYYLSASSAGALTTTKPIGTNSAPLGFFLPVVYVESANVIHVLGQSHATFDPLLAQHTFGSNAQGVTFSNLDISAHGSYRLEGEVIGGAGHDYYVTLNGESFTSGNYGNQETTEENTSVSTQRATGGTLYSRYARNIGSSTGFAFEILFQRYGSTGYLLPYRSSSVDGTVTTVINRRGTITRLLSNNLTSITLDSSTTSSYLTGSTLRLYRGKW